MKRMTQSGWRLAMAVTCMAAAIGVGAVWADNARPAPAAVTAANHAAAVEAFKKARDLFQADKLPEANAENNQALKLDPNFSDAQLLQKIIAGKMSESAGTGAAPETGTQAETAKGNVRLLKPTDVALIKVNEWSATADAQLRGTVARKTLEDFWTQVVKKTDTTVTKEQHDTFLKPSSFVDQVQRIKDSGDAKYMEQVKFNGDPAALMAFKRQVEPYVMQNCATAACHAGDKAGNFRLVRAPSGAADVSVYTNFYILAMYQDGNGNKMIDRDSPAKSLLLQYGMVKANAATPHPGKVEPHYFADKSDTKFTAMTDWIRTLKFPLPHYGIVYEIPGAAPAATTATTRPAATMPAKKPTR